MDITDLIPFREAIASLLEREIMPTNLGHDELRALGKDVLDRSIFSAHNHYEDILTKIQEEVTSFVNPKTEFRADGTPVTTGTDFASSRYRLMKAFEEIGYVPPERKAGTIQDLASEARINLVIETNARIAQGYGYARQGQDPDVLDAWPCQELVRLEERKVPRDDWDERWVAACEEAGDEGAQRVYDDTDRMVARKDSGVWQALGNGAGGFTDTLLNPFEPFAFGSGMGCEDVTREEAMELGLIGLDDQITPIRLNYAMEAA